MQLSGLQSLTAVSCFCTCIVSKRGGLQLVLMGGSVRLRMQCSLASAYWKDVESTSLFETCAELLDLLLCATWSCWHDIFFSYFRHRNPEQVGCTKSYSLRDHFTKDHVSLKLYMPRKKEKREWKVSCVLSCSGHENARHVWGVELSTLW